MKKLLVTISLAFSYYCNSQSGYDVYILTTNVNDFDVIGKDEYELNNKVNGDITSPLKVEVFSSVPPSINFSDSIGSKFLLDGNMKTCWLSSGNPLLDVIEFVIDVEENEAIHSAVLREIFFVNGWRKNLQTWKEYSKIKKAFLFINEKPYGEVTFENTYKFQSIFLDKYKIEKTRRYRFKLKILETYKGEKFEQVGISDVQFVGRIR